ncbi:hypothetical protein ES703_22328 [subsurface metagenome]
MIDDGIQGNGRLARGAIADNKLALSSAQRNKAVDGFNTRLHRCVHRLTAGNVGRYSLHGQGLLSLDRPLAIEGIAQGIDHPPDKGFTHRHLGDTPRAAHLVSFFNLGIIAQYDSGHAIFFQVQGDAHNIVGKLQQLVILGRRQPVNAGDAIANLNHGADIDHGHRCPELLNLLFDDRNNVLPSYGHLSHLLLLHFTPPPANSFFNAISRLMVLPSSNLPPTLAIIPPTRLGSTLAVNVTFLPTTFPRCSSSFCLS